MAVGDANFESGNGGTDLERYEQLNSLTKTLYVTSQDSSDCAAAACLRGSEQPNITLLSPREHVLGFHQITDSVDRPDLQGMYTFVYPSTGTC